MEAPSAAEAEAAEKQPPPAVEWRTQVRCDQDGLPDLPKVPRKFQLSAGAKIEQALIAAGRHSGERLEYPFVGNVFLGRVDAHKQHGVPGALALAVADVEAAAAASDLEPEEQEAVVMAVTLVRFYLQINPTKPPPGMNRRDERTRERPAPLGHRLAARVWAPQCCS
jgi:hypothetical protein